MGCRDQSIGCIGINLSTTSAAMVFASSSLMSAYLNPLPQVELFSDRQWIDAMLRFEAQLAMAQAECGLVPQAAAQAIAQACASVALHPESLAAQARQTGALGMAVVAPLQQWLQRHAPEGLPWLHWGTTTQDVVDTANAMLTAHALEALQRQLKGLQQSLLHMAHEHAATPVLGRSLLQPAQITSFGLKCAQTAAALGRSSAQLQRLAAQALCVQLGGAVGNSAALGGDAMRVEQALAHRLGLKACGYSWHTQRDDWMRLGMEVAVCGGSLAKLAKDWALHAQYEVGELCEAARGITSSAMPHKRNPVHCLQALAQTKAVPQLAATLLACMDQAHERALGEWQAEVVHWAQLWTHVHAGAAALCAAAQGMQVHAPRMQAHIDSLQGVVFSEQLAQVILPLLGKPEAQAAVALCAQQALQQGQPLPALLAAYLKAQGHAVSQALHAQLHAAADVQAAAQASALRCHELLTQMSSAGQPAPLNESIA